MQLVLYHRVVADPAVAAMVRYREEGTRDAYLQLVREVLAAAAPGVTGDAWRDHLLRRILVDANPFTLAAGRGECPPELVEAAAFDLRQLQTLYEPCADCPLPPEGDLPRWPGFSPAAWPRLSFAERLATASDWGSLAAELAAFHRQGGVGMLAEYWHLRWENGELQGVDDPDLVRLEDLVSLDEAKEIVLRNTAQLLRGLPANNLLLYGPRGCGKSSLVKALPGVYGSQGLRLVELDRADLHSLPGLFAALRTQPQRFVVFIDDLAFSDSETDYRRFKTAMEGSIARRPGNVAIYATSNRRHLMPERWQDREGAAEAEVHGQDGMQERMALVDRFGVTVWFRAPDQEEYLRIVEHLARRRGLTLSRERLRQEALRWERSQNGRSGRTAVQFLDDLEGRLAAGLVEVAD